MRWLWLALLLTNNELLAFFTHKSSGFLYRSKYQIRRRCQKLTHLLSVLNPQQGQLDYPGFSRQTPASRRGHFKGLGTDAAQAAVAAGTVVKGFDIVEHV